MMPKDKINFTRKQLEYIKLSADGYSSQEIADKYGVSKASVDILFSYVLTNYKFKSRTSLIAYCLRKQLIS